jgi:RIO kinase 1
MPDSLAALVDYGIIQEVIRPLMSGKEAQVYLVMSEGEVRVAKVYKEAQARTFKHRAEYTEGRKTRNTRDQRAMAKRTRHGRAQDEAAWRSTEVDMIHRLSDAGVRVPKPHQFIDGVLVMELIKDADGNPAPRLGDLSLGPEQAREIYDDLIGQTVRMLCAGVVHGDLSDFNVLMGANGPAVIDFPQSVDPASNQNARRLLLRDVENLHRFLTRFVPEASPPPYAQEMWELYQGNRLRPETKLRGRFHVAPGKTDTSEVLALIGDAREEERERREARGEDLESTAPKPHRAVVDFSKEAPKQGAKRRRRKEEGRGDAPAKRAGGKKRASRKRRASPRSSASEENAPAPAQRIAPKSAAARQAAAGEGEGRRRRRPKRAGARKGGASNVQSTEGSATGKRPDERPAQARTKAGSGDTLRDTRAKPAASPAKKRGRRRRRPASRKKSPPKA